MLAVTVNFQTTMHQSQVKNKSKRQNSTFFPLSMYLTATSSLVFLSLTSLATPKFPVPRSFNGSYLSSISATTFKIPNFPTKRDYFQSRITEEMKANIPRKARETEKQIKQRQTPKTQKRKNFTEKNSPKARRERELEVAGEEDDNTGRLPFAAKSFPKTPQILTEAKSHCFIVEERTNN